jgi:hypothetical protein
VVEVTGGEEEVGGRMISGVAMEGDTLKMISGVVCPVGGIKGSPRSTPSTSAISTHVWLLPKSPRPPPPPMHGSGHG